MFRTMLFLLVLCAARPAAASGQDVVTDGIQWSSEVRVLGANALIGGASAGLVSLLRGATPGEAGRAIARGAAGCALVYAGKRVVVERWFGAGLIGRQVGLLGARSCGTRARDAGA